MSVEEMLYLTGFSLALSAFLLSLGALARYGMREGGRFHAWARGMLFIPRGVLKGLWCSLAVDYSRSTPFGRQRPTQAQEETFARFARRIDEIPFTSRGAFASPPGVALYREQQRLEVAREQNLLAMTQVRELKTKLDEAMAENKERPGL
jgi:hypothetical protein